MDSKYVYQIQRISALFATAIIQILVETYKTASWLQIFSVLEKIHFWLTNSFTANISGLKRKMIKQQER